MKINLIFLCANFEKGGAGNSIIRLCQKLNIKLMKAGGYLNGIHLLKEANKYGLKTMIGCMVESSLGISNGFFLSSLADYLDLDSFMILKNDSY